jgi:dTDP-4-dehydrorhamnose 3,5-epimerase
VVEAHWEQLEAQARERCEPLLVPLSYYCDDRGWSLMNLLPGALSPAGQINCSTQLPGVVKAWHRHRAQSDFWVCVSGQIKAGVCREDGARWACVLGEHRPALLVIPPTLWHGAATVGRDPAVLLYYVTQQHDPSAPDEERLAWDAIEGFPWSVQNR